MAQLNTWYSKKGVVVIEKLFQIGIRHPDGQRFTITMSPRDHIFVSNDYTDVEGWHSTSVRKLQGKVVSKKISKGKPFVIRQIFSMVDHG